MAVQVAAGGDAVIVAVAVTLAGEFAAGATVSVLLPVAVKVTAQVERLLHAAICVPLSFHTYVLVLLHPAV